MQKNLRKSRIPIGPKGEKRPADVIGNAVRVMQLATGEAEEIFASDNKNEGAVSLGKLGGKARAKALTPEKRKKIAQKAAKERWMM